MRDYNNVSYVYRLFDIVTKPEPEPEVTDVTRNSAGGMFVQY